MSFSYNKSTFIVVFLQDSTLYNPLLYINKIIIVLLSNHIIKNKIIKEYIKWIQEPSSKNYKRQGTQ